MTALPIKSTLLSEGEDLLLELLSCHWLSDWGDEEVVLIEGFK